MQIQMGIIKVEISIPEAFKALEEFRGNRKRALESITRDVKDAVSHSLNQLLQTEMTLFLGKPEQSSNKRNGGYERTYALKGIGAIRINMPRDRKPEFKSVVIPAHEQINPRLKEDMAVLHLAGISTRMLAMMSRRVLGIEVSTDTVSLSLGTIEVQARSWLTRPLEKKYWALFIDGTNFRMRPRFAAFAGMVLLHFLAQNCAEFGSRLHAQPLAVRRPFGRSSRDSRPSDCPSALSHELIEIFQG